MGFGGMPTHNAYSQCLLIILLIIAAHITLLPNCSSRATHTKTRATRNKKLLLVLVVFSMTASVVFSISASVVFVIDFSYMSR